MDNTRYGNAIDFDVDLHSIYAAYLGLFESTGAEWWEKSWGGFFTTFNDFLGFGWEVMVVVDTHTGRPHIAVRREQIGLFAKMIRTRFGESLPKDPPTTLPLVPVPTRNLSLRRLITIHDLASFRKLSQTLPAAELSYTRSRVRSGQVGVLEQLFYAGGPSGERDTGGIGLRDNGVGYTWACVKTTWWEKGGSPSGLIPGQGRTQSKGAGGKGVVLEVGMAVVRCANLRAVNVWPPLPEDNYRKSHFIAEEWVDKRQNSNPPSYPRTYTFGKSRFVSERDIEKIVDATLGALATQENDANPNQLILLHAGETMPLPVPSTSALPNNILHVDVFALEYNLLRRAQADRIPGTPDRQTPLTSLGALLQALQIPVPPMVPLGNAGNEAYYTVLAFQKLMMAETRLPELLFQNDGFYPSPAYMPPHTRHASHNSIPRLYVPSPPESPRRQTDRPRPASYGDNFSPTRTASHEPPASVRSVKPPMNRSQTVYWDDAEYANDARPTENKRESLRPVPVSNSEDSIKGSGSRPPPSSFRKANGDRSATRSISWDQSPLEPPRPLNDTSRNRQSTSSLASISSLRRPNPPAFTNDSRSGSSLKLSYDSKSSSDTKDSVPRELSRQSLTQSPADSLPKDKEKDKGKGKLKSEKSVKDIAGALARFWVG